MFALAELETPFSTHRVWRQVHDIHQDCLLHGVPRIRDDGVESR